MSRRMIAVTVGILFVAQMVTAMVGTALAADGHAPTAWHQACKAAPDSCRTNGFAGATA